MLDFFKLKHGAKDFFLIVLIGSFVVFSLAQIAVLVNPYLPYSSNTTEIITKTINNKEVKIELTLNEDKEIIGSQVIK